jgi:hypothetical protein
VLYEYNKKGETRNVRLLESVHPVLDSVAVAYVSGIVKEKIPKSKNRKASMGQNISRGPNKTAKASLRYVLPIKFSLIGTSKQ